MSACMYLCMNGIDDGIDDGSAQCTMMLGCC